VQPKQTSQYTLEEKLSETREKKNPTHGKTSNAGPLWKTKWSKWGEGRVMEIQEKRKKSRGREKNHGEKEETKNRVLGTARPVLQGECRTHNGHKGEQGAQSW